MKRLLWVLVFAVAPTLGAQTPSDTAGPERLRAEIEQRFAERVKVELGLTDEQVTRLKATQERYGERRRALMRQQFERRLALQGQMRPGVQANADSVRKLMDGFQAGRAELFKLEQEEDREMAAYLTPVQQAQFQMMRERFLQRVQEMRRERAMMRGREPGMRPEGRRPGPEGRRPRRRP